MATSTHIKPIAPTVMADTATATANHKKAAAYGPLALSERKQQQEGGARETQQRAAIDALICARLELQKAENNVRDNAQAIAAAERALQQVKGEKAFHAYYAGVKRAEVEAASDAVCDALSLPRQQQGFRSAAREAGLFASKEMARAMLMVAREEKEEAAAEAVLSPSYAPVSKAYTPVSPSYTPTSPPPPPGAPTKKRGLLWRDTEEEEAEARRSSSSRATSNNNNNKRWRVGLCRCARGCADCSSTEDEEPSRAYSPTLFD